MNAAQVINSWWDNFSRLAVGQFCLLVCFALGLGERNTAAQRPGGSRSQCSDAGAERRTRGVGRAGVPGARNAGTVGAGAAQPLERSKPAASVTASSGAHDRRSEAQRPVGLYPRGMGALTPQGEPAVSQSEGPCGPSGATSGSVTEGRSRAERDTDPLPSAAAAEVVVAAQGRSGVPTGLSTPDAIARATERTGPRSFATQAPQP